MHPIAQLIDKADAAINQEDFDALMTVYTDDAVLVIRPGMNAVGKGEIRQAFENIAAYFKHSLTVQQAGMEILETGDTALVLANTIIEANDHPPMERKATYVFRKDADHGWQCAIDNSYGHELLAVKQSQGSG